MIDEAALLAWIKERGQMKSLVGGSIYQGIYDRIRNGQFEQKEGNEDDDLVQGR